jgi:hypothetical protein
LVIVRKQLTNGLLQRLIVKGEPPAAWNATAKQVSPLAGMWAANPDDRPSSAAIVICMEAAEFCLGAERSNDSMCIVCSLTEGMLVRELLLGQHGKTILSKTLKWPVACLNHSF